MDKLTEGLLEDLCGTHLLSRLSRRCCRLERRGYRQKSAGWLSIDLPTIPLAYPCDAMKSANFSSNHQEQSEREKKLAHSTAAPRRATPLNDTETDCAALARCMHVRTLDVCMHVRPAGRPVGRRLAS